MELTREDKTQHHDTIEYFVDLINNKIKSETDFCQLKLIAYRMDVQKKPLYFDYPYAEIVDEVNKELLDNGKLAGLDERIYSSLRENTDKGGYSYLYYEYEYIDNEFLIYGLKSNIEITQKNIEDVCAFLPVMFVCTYLEGLVTANISDKRNNYTEPNNYKHLLVLHKETEYKNKTIISNAVLEANNNIYFPLDSKAQKAIKYVFDFIDKFTNKNVLLAKFQAHTDDLERHKEADIAFRNRMDTFAHHFFNTLPNVQTIISESSIFLDSYHPNSQNYWDMIKADNQLKLIELEYRILAGKELKYINDKNIKGILDFIWENQIVMKAKGVSTYKEFESNNDILLIPKGKEQYVYLILWNLFHNAQKCQTYFSKNTRSVSMFWIQFDTYNNKLVISFKNEGLMPVEIREKLLQKKSVQKNPDRKNGLTIVQESMIELGWSFLDIIVTEADKTNINGFTEIIILT
jgi:hypothetical protein